MSRIFDLSQSDPMEQEFDPFHAWPYDARVQQAKWTAVWLAVVFLLCLIPSCTKHGQLGLTREYSDEEFAQAIKKDENPIYSKRAWTYGITSIPCSSEVQCHGIAIRTIQNNRRRFAVYGHRRYPDFIHFLQSRWCPSSEDYCQTWIKNVTYFLKKDDHASIH